MGRGRGQGLVVGNAACSAQAALEVLVRPCLDPLRDGRPGRAAVRRVVLEPPVRGRIVRGRDDHAVGVAARAAAIVGENRM